ncbi:S8 family serine peptidase [Aquiflexum sp. TKW24L]|uniref:S8 family serine peptidase n=1 Tax=Aquiflexum sp. TKW24L TaxID=2942212 RepID=UPI0020C14011|nr:S8 family serine peptidase [Aquiflexum sp. TKW24L]MCL6260271.1 S8 family serine peptidase [Aquiflexum sp. TKW24L]
MANFNRFLFSVCCFLVVSISYGQNRYAVHFKYKPQDSYSLNRPSEFLSQEAVERKARFDIPIDSLDLPVSSKYVSGLASKSSKVLYHINWMNASLVEADPAKISEIAALPYVEKVVLAAPGMSSAARIGISNKVGFNSSFKSNSKTEATPYDFQNDLIGIPAMHAEGFKGSGIMIAVFDAGFPGVNTIPAFSHLFTNNQIVATGDFVHLGNSNVYNYNQHGTNAMSLIAANQENLLVSGAPEARYILAITEDVPTEYRIEEYNWVRAASWADSLGVDIISSSLGYWDFDDPSMDYTKADLDGKTATVTIGAGIAATKGILVVNSAGNYGSRGAISIIAPADAEGILSVGAVNSDLVRAGFSSQGPTADGRFKPEVSAFGNSAQVIRSNGTLGPSNGTSFSAPQIAALAAGLWEARPDWSKDDLIKYILRSSSQYDNPDNLLGYGIPDFSKAYFGEILSILTLGKESDFKVYPNPLSGGDLFVQFGKSLAGEFSLYDVNGAEIQKIEIQRASVDQPFEISLPMIPKGMFLVQMQSGREVKRTKLLKR